MFNTLNKLSLAEAVHDNQRNNYHETCRVLNRNFICRLVCTRLFAEDIERVRHYRPESVACEKQGFRGRHEGVNVEDICPLPCESKDEDGCEHRAGDRNDDVEEGLKYAVTVNVRGFFEFVRYATIELTHQEDEETVLKCKTREGEQNDRCVSVVKTLRKTDCLKESCCLKNTEDIEVEELLYECRGKDLMRNDHGEHNDEEDRVTTLEFELRKTITDERADKSLNDRANGGKDERVQKCCKVMVFDNQILIGIDRRIFRNQLNVTLDKVQRAHEGAGDLREEREKNDIGDTEKENEAENRDQNLGVESAIEILRLHSFFEGGSFEINPDSIFGFF